ncbi:hypothetical protein SLEP1_g4004 [Rubroshorea leprosula]|uniref:Uncharacterized protein n=1 Tax=Rubroshorea leprosula TaxID=152421 RepID=A0AAV5HRN7_9ROSI|nr:hypothetical protein SLEP1_g4004 [Rubroshorea leprosula]
MLSRLQFKHIKDFFSLFCFAFLPTRLWFISVSATCPL